MIKNNVHDNIFTEDENLNVETIKHRIKTFNNNPGKIFMVKIPMVSLASFKGTIQYMDEAHEGKAGYFNVEALISRRYEKKLNVFQETITRAKTHNENMEVRITTLDNCFVVECIGLDNSMFKWSGLMQVMISSSNKVE